MSDSETGTGAGTGSLHKVMLKVQKLIAMAEAEINPNNTAAEREAILVEQQKAREQADALMLKYAIEQAALDEAAPAGAKRTGTKTTFIIGEYGEVVGYVARLAEYVADYCRCITRLYTAHTSDGWVGTVYGYEGDVRYFEVMYTTLRLHMLGVLIPKIDPAKSLDENCYSLHNAGFNWLEIAKLYGWEKIETSIAAREYDCVDRYYDEKEIWGNQATREVQTNTKLGSSYKRAYHRAVKARGEQPTLITASGSKTFRVSAARGYASQINTRLRHLAGKRSAGSELALSREALEQWFRSQNPGTYAECPKCGKWTYKGALICDQCGEQIREQTEDEKKPAKGGRTRAYKPAPFNRDAYGRGVDHANTADIGGAKVGGEDAKAIG